MRRVGGTIAALILEIQSHLAHEPPLPNDTVVLVADDDDAIRQLIERLLTGAGYQVLTARTR